jgi:chromosome segregation ATPase
MRRGEDFDRAADEIIAVQQQEIEARVSRAVEELGARHEEASTSIVKATQELRGRARMYESDIQRLKEGSERVKSSLETLKTSAAERGEELVVQRQRVKDVSIQFAQLQRALDRQAARPDQVEKFVLQVGQIAYQYAKETGSS